MKFNHGESHEINLENNFERGIFKCIYALRKMNDIIHDFPVMVEKSFLYATDGKIMFKIKTDFDFEGKFEIVRVSQHKYYLVTKTFMMNPDYKKIINNLKDEKEICETDFRSRSYYNKNLIKILRACPLDQKYVKLVSDFGLCFKFFASEKKSVFKNNDITIIVMALNID